MKKAALLAVLALLSIAAFSATGYRLLKKIPIPGDGSWDYMSADNVNRRIYVSHGSQIDVVDADSGAVVGQIPAPTADASGKPVPPQTHGAAIAPDLGRGFTSNGRAASMTIFDLKSLKTLGEVHVEEGPDGFLYDPSTHRVFSFSRRTKGATAVDGAEGTVAGSIDLDGAPEAATADGKGHAFVNIQDKDLVVKFDSRKLTIDESWPVAPCHQPSSMAIDAARQRLFIGCRNKMLAVVDASNGRVITTLPIGGYTDAAVFDPEANLVFVASGDGNVTVIRQESAEKYVVADTVTTEPGAKTMALDLKTHRLFLSTADFKTAAPTGPSGPGGPPRETPFVPGTFRVLIVGRE